MTLDSLFAELAPCLEGQRDVADARARIYGDRAGSVDAGRLAIYARFCKSHRFAALESVYSHLHAAVRALHGDAGWARLVDGYFRHAPMHHVELRENGAALPEFLVEHAGSLALPAWCAALADLEWWEWRTSVALDEPGEPDDTAAPAPLGIAPTVELRPYAWDLPAWLDVDDALSDAAPDAHTGPAPGATLVLFYRDHDLAARRRVPDARTLRVLKSILDGAAPDPAEDPTAWSATLAELVDAGIVTGAA